MSLSSPFLLGACISLKSVYLIVIELYQLVLSLRVAMENYTQKLKIQLEEMTRRYVVSDPKYALPELIQTSAVMEFQLTIEELKDKRPWMSEPLLIICFIFGLKPELHRELLFSWPSTLSETFAIARAHEAWMKETQVGIRSGPKCETAVIQTPNHPNLTQQTRPMAP